MLKHLAFTTVVLAAVLGGCPGQVNVDNAQFQTDIQQLVAASGTIQTQPEPAVLPPPLVQDNDQIIIDSGVTIIDNPSQDILVQEVPNITILGFRNDTGADIYLQYDVEYPDGEIVDQAVYVFDGETLLLEYDCLASFQIISEDDIDPVDGTLLGSFDIGELFFNPDDFSCGDAVIVTVEFDRIVVQPTLIDFTQ